MRLDKYLADYTELTRSQAKQQLRNGNIRVNGEIVKKGNETVSFSDSVFWENRKVEGTRYQYIMLNKPKGVVSATVDKKCATVVDCIGEKTFRMDGNDSSSFYLAKDLFPVGRLDKDTEGLLFLTNNGEMAHRMLSPVRHVPKKYFVQLDAALDTTDVEKMKEGIDIGERRPAKPAEMEILSEMECFLTITEGKYHQVKRMFQRLGKTVIRLKRVEMAGVKLDESLAAGEWRFLREEEIRHLAAATEGNTFKYQEI